jgi:DNA modification methylase
MRRGGSWLSRWRKNKLKIAYDGIEVNIMRKPYFQNSRVTVYCGDSREVLQELKDAGETFDLMLTDPPYGLNQPNNKGSGLNARRGKAMYADNMFEDTPDYLREVVRPIIDSGLSLSTLGIITGGVGSWRYLPPPNEEGCMYMPAAPSFNTWAHSDFQPIFYYGKPQGNTGKYRKLSHTVTERGFCKSHPCAKPLEFWKKLMLCGTDGIDGKRILDPFGGSGTT